MSAEDVNPDEVLHVDGWFSFCGKCGQQTLPDAETHIDISGYKAVKGGGCGVRWRWKSSTYGEPLPHIRPDLPQVGLIQRDRRVLP